MKKLILLMIIISTGSLSAQSYKVNALMAEGFVVKYDGVLKITDSLFLLTSTYKGKEQATSYDIINERNNLVYLTDGISIHHYTIQQKNGKKKGEKYTHELYFTSDNSSGRGLMVYYIEEIN